MGTKPTAGKGRRSFGMVRRLSSGRYQATYLGPDSVRHAAPGTFETKTDAEGWLHVESRLVERHKTEGAPWTPPRERGQRQVGEVLTLRAWGPGAIDRRRVRGRALKPTTLHNYRWHLDHSFGALLDMPMRSITPEAVSKWHDEVHADRPTLKAQAYATLRTLLRQAADEGLIDAAPTKVKGAGRAERAHRIETATPAEIAAFAEAMPERLRAFVLLAAWCGLRWGELAELRRRDVDLSAGVVRVERAVTRVDGETIVSAPKTAAGRREVAVPPVMVPALRYHLDNHTGRGRDALLFPRPGTNEHMLHKHSNEELAKAREAIGRPDLRLHDLRHTSAVLAAQAGATLAELMARLGHTTPDAAMRYQHQAKGRDAEIARRMSAL